MPGGKPCGKACSLGFRRYPSAGLWRGFRLDLYTKLYLCTIGPIPYNCSWADGAQPGRAAKRARFDSARERTQTEEARRRMDTTLARPREGLRPRGQRYLENLLSGAGIEINGGRPYDMRVLDDRIFTRALTGGVEGLLDGYVQGWWETDRFDELTARLLSNAVSLPESSRTSLLLASLAARLFNLHTRRRTLKLRKHYDLGNDLFEAMLDPRLVYSCAYWKNASTLEEAQEAKLDLIAKKIGLKPGMRVLDIGCGWGGFAKFVAERYGVSVVAITIAKEQYKLAKSRCEGLPVEVRLQDYRDLRETPFDAVVSIAMFEAVGFKNYSHFMKIVRRHLKPDGLFLLHTIGGNVSSVTGNAWVERNIFPDGMLPSAKQLSAAAEDLMVIEDWHNFGADYDKTLLAWFRNFEANWPRLRDKYGDRFYRMWKCYLMIFAGAFRVRYVQLWQIVFSPSGIRGGCQSVR